uniref:Protein MON2 homolog isoform X3 n=1 Tax=Rhizophora mucronata TaxID=61149 RepID=A0A2P2MTQ2_RHIMU
MHIKVLKKNS